MVVDGFSRDRLSNLEVVGMLLDKAVQSNANFICFTFNLAFDPQGRVLNSAPIHNSDSAMRPEDLIPAIRLARAKGLRVMIKPQTTIYDAVGPTSVGNVQIYFVQQYPNFNVDTFFADYEAKLEDFAAMAEAEGVEIFSVGTENDGLNGADREVQWRSLIGSVRQRFSGALTYGASVRFWQVAGQFDDFRAVQFWDALDFVGLSLYPGWAHLPGKFSDYEPMMLFSQVQWNPADQPIDVKSLIQPVLDKYGKKLFIEEFGFQASPQQLQNYYDVGFFSAPIDELGLPDYENQSNAYVAYFRYFLSAFADDMVGFNPWVLNGSPGAFATVGLEKRWRLSQFLVIGDGSGNIFDKPALEVIGQFFGGARSDEVVIHRPPEGYRSAGGMFRDLFIRPQSIAANTSGTALVTADGGSNIDTVNFPASRSDYNLLAGNGQIRAWRIGANPAFADVFANIERMQFSDVTVNLGAGEAARTISPLQLDSLIELYIAYVGRVPDADGMIFWINQIKAGQNLDQVGQRFYEAAVQFSDLTGYSATMPDVEFIRLIYRNVLGRSQPDAEGVDFWSRSLANGQATRGTLVAAMLASAHTFKGHAQYGFVADLLDNKIAIGKFFAVTKGHVYETPQANILNGMAIAAAVTPTDTTAAMALIGVKDGLTLY